MKRRKMHVESVTGTGALCGRKDVAMTTAEYAQRRYRIGMAEGFCWKCLGVMNRAGQLKEV